MKIYLLVHERESEYLSNDCSFFDPKIIGIFYKKKHAKKILKEFKTKPGFKKFPNNFVILKMKVDKNYFKRGF